MSSINKPQRSSSGRSILASLYFTGYETMRGQYLLRDKLIRSIHTIEAGKEYLGRFEIAGRSHETFVFQIEHKWTSACSCGLNNCQHAYAVASTLDSYPSFPPQISALTDEPDSAFSKLALKLKRPLHREERFWILATIHIKHIVQFSSTKKLLCSTLAAELRIPLPPTLTTLDSTLIYIPKSGSDLEFFHSLILTLKSMGFALPPLEILSLDDPRVEEEIRLADYHRLVDSWLGNFRNIERARSNFPDGSGSRSTNVLQVRVVIEDSKAYIQTRAGLDAKWETPTLSRWNKIHFSFDSVSHDMDPPSLFILLEFCNPSRYAREPVMDIDRGAGRLLIRRMLREEIFHDRLCGSDYEPLRRETDARLEWRLFDPEPGTTSRLYRLQLYKPNGEELKEPCLVFPGNTSYYICGNTVFHGPGTIENTLSINAPNLIPAEVVESRLGLNIFARLGIKLTESLSKLVEHIPLRLRLSCSHDKVWEVVVLNFEALTPKGERVELYEDSHWREVHTNQDATTTTNGRIEVYDRDALVLMPGLLEAAPIRWSNSQSRFEWKIRKSFPEKFSDWLSRIPEKVEVVLEDFIKGLDESPVLAKVELDCTPAELDWFDLKVRISVEDTTLTEEEVQLLLKARGKFVLLPNKGWRRIKFDLSEEEDENLARLGLSAHDLSAPAQKLHVLQIAEGSKGASDQLLSEDLKRQLMNRRQELLARVTPEIPSSIRGQLRPYQVEGYHFLAYLSTNHFGGILADDMGLGKTLQTLCWLAWLKKSMPKEPKSSPSLVVCPKSVTDNWRTDATKFYPELRVCVFRSHLESEFETAHKEHDLLVLNYAQLRNLDGTIQRHAWEAVILDEGQFIKNPQSITATVARSISAKHRLVLTGTPIENRLMDLWSLMAFAMPGALGNQHQFGKLYGNSSDPLARKRLSARVRPFLIRRTKTQVARDLPDRIEEDLSCEMEGEQLELYRAELKLAQKMLLKLKVAKDLNEFRFSFLSALTRLRQICCHPGLVSEGLDQTSSAKVEALVDLLEPLMAEGQKVLVFSQFTRMLDRIAASLKEREWQYYMLTGETENRGNLVEKFQEQSKEAVFLISLRAGGFGLNLTSASYVVIFDPWWNPAVENQAIDRTHRIGQKNKVFAYRLVTKDTIEEKIRKLQKMKSALAQVLTEEDFSSALTLDDIRFLLSDEG